VISSTWSTEEKRGPVAKSFLNPSTLFAGPSANASTLPSSRFFTYPTIWWRAAARWAKNRKPTPCTSPLTTNLRAILDIWPWVQF